MASDIAKRERLQKRGMPVPRSISDLANVRYVADNGDWYIETEEGKVYWWDGKEWRFLPHGAL